MSEVLKQKLAQVQRCQARYCRWNKKNQCTKIFITVNDEGACQQYEFGETFLPIGQDKDVGDFSYLSATDV
tara:strand:+ start:9094 stop:9306 length:213 start_codon:yes stop_codon:yes gene_type:complete